MPSEIHSFLAASSETGAAVVEAEGAATGAVVAGVPVEGTVDMLLATVPAEVSVKVSVVVVPAGLTWRVSVTPAGVTLVCVAPGGPPAGFVVVCVVACPSV